ncbi:MAG: glycosyltransferase family 2 protein [Burkholderiales bacterium]|nr:glycosyltransferase family 2 protein [Burkholderiales bacterium]
MRSPASDGATPSPVAEVAAVIVTFQPAAGAIEPLLAALQGQVGRVVLVDNGSRVPPVLPTASGPLKLLQLDSNLGLAAAQNRGIATAVEAGARFVLLLDQDSLPEPGMVAALLRCHDQAVARGQRVAAVGPTVLAPDGSEAGFVRFGGGRYEAVMPAADIEALACDMLIASGSLIPVPVLQQLGGMAEPLFIDKVDTEWCLRAAAAGHLLLGAPQARLRHRLGERLVRVWFGQWRALPQHQPFRYYYMLRNSLLLRRLPHACAAWRRADLRQLGSIVLYFGLLSPGRWAALRMMGRGLLDGLRAVGGPLR